ncbi:MAG: hypothetical protein HZY75_15770 [Nocardioidaceae bacterium]|nr:MAG: hypothetical protein HZY75_15770 [Nocardioidaceae bacterium]
MLAFVHASKDALFEVLDRANAEAVVGPTSASGWTASWVDDDEPVRAAFPDYVLLFSHDKRTRLCVSRDGASSETDFPRKENAAAFGRVVADLGALWKVDPAAIADSLSDEMTDPDTVLHALSEVVALPDLEEPDLDTAVVVIRAKPGDVRMAAELAGPLCLLPIGNGWFVFTGQVETMAGAAAAASSMAGRNSTVIRLWRRGAESGYEQWRQGKPEAGWSWNELWRHTAASRVRAAAEVAEVLSERFSAGVTDPVALRALLRRDVMSGDPLLEFLPLIGVPTDPVAILDQPADSVPEGSELIAKLPWYKAFFTRTSPEVLVRARSRPVWLKATLLGLRVIGALALVVIAVLRAGSGDWLYAVWAVLLAVYFAWGLAWRWRYVGINRGT